MIKYQLAGNEQLVEAPQMKVKIKACFGNLHLAVERTRINWGRGTTEPQLNSQQ